MRWENFTYRHIEIKRCKEDFTCTYKNFRVHIAIAPITPQGACVSFRRHPDSPWTFQALEKKDWASLSDLQRLKDLVINQHNLLIVGPTGSGKTSILNACLQEIPNNERVVCIEDTNEIKLPNIFSTKLLTRKSEEDLYRDFSQQDLLYEALRMRPQRLVMGEIRGPEAKDYLMALSTGHSGCLCTLHADNAKQALWRLEMLVQMGAPQWSLETVRRLIHLSVHRIVLLENQNTTGQRSLEGIYKISSLEDFGFLIEKEAEV